MDRFFSLDYSGPGFVLFGPAHLSLVGALALVGWLLIRAGQRGGEQDRSRLRLLLGSFFLLNETGTHLFALAQGTWAIHQSLPLQLCGAMAWVCGFSLVFGVRRADPLIYFFGLGGALQGVVTPDAGTYGFPHYLMIETIVAHSALVIAGLWVIIVERYRPTFRHLLAVLAGLNLAALVMYFVNLGLGSNYLFVNAKPPNASIVDLMPDWPMYIPVLEIIAIILFTTLYLPFVRLKPAEEELAAERSRS